MLGTRRSKFSAGGSTTLVARTTTVVGDIHFSGSLDIEGTVKGNIIADSGKDALVRIVEKGRVQGEIRAPSVIVNGVVEGNVYAAKHLELAPKGCVHGDVYYSLLEMAAGSEVNGSLTHIEEPGSSPEKNVTSTAEASEVASSRKTRDSKRETELEMKSKPKLEANTAATAKKVASSKVD